MTPEVTPAHREILAHLLDVERSPFGVVPAALAGHYPAGSDQANLDFDWIDPIPAFAHPADPARLLIGVFTDLGWTLVALDQIAHAHCLHPICTAVIGRRSRELAEVPADAGLFAAMQVDTSFDTIPLTYVVHIEDYLTAQANGWTGHLHDHTTLHWRNPDESWAQDEEGPACLA